MRDILLAPFIWIWEFFDPIVAIPLILILGSVFLYGFADLMMFILYGDLEEETTTEPDRDWKFYPEDFE